MEFVFFARLCVSCKRYKNLFFLNRIKCNIQNGQHKFARIYCYFKMLPFLINVSSSINPKCRLHTNADPCSANFLFFSQYVLAYFCPLNVRIVRNSRSSCRVTYDGFSYPFRMPYWCTRVFGKHFVGSVSEYWARKKAIFLMIVSASTSSPNLHRFASPESVSLAALRNFPGMQSRRLCIPLSWYSICFCRQYSAKPQISLNSNKEFRHYFHIFIVVC